MELNLKRRFWGMAGLFRPQRKSDEHHQAKKRAREKKKAANRRKRVPVVTLARPDGTTEKIRTFRSPERILALRQRAEQRKLARELKKNHQPALLPTPGKVGVYGYVRVSTQHQTHGESIASQKAQIADLAKKLGHGAIDHIFVDEEVSGGIPILERPSGRELGYHAAPGSIILMTDIDRGFRNTADFLLTSEAWKAMGIRLVVGSINQMGLQLDTDSPSTKLVTTILAATKEYERRQRVEHVKACMAQAKVAAAKEGHDVSTKVYAPFGYRWSYVRNDRRKTKLTPHEPDMESLALLRYFLFKQPDATHRGKQGAQHPRWGLGAYYDNMSRLGKMTRLVSRRSQMGKRGDREWLIGDAEHPLFRNSFQENRMKQMAWAMFPDARDGLPYLKSLARRAPVWARSIHLNLFIQDVENEHGANHPAEVGPAPAGLPGGDVERDPGADGPAREMARPGDLSDEEPSVRAGHHLPDHPARGARLDGGYPGGVESGGGPHPDPA